MTDDLLGGLDRLRDDDARWVQIDVAVPLPATTLAAAVEEITRRAPVGRWWFVRKPPGVRVRMEATGPPAALRDAARSRLGEFGPATPSDYESERYRFGGTAGTAVAHDLFALDSALAVLRERHGVRGTRWSARILGDLNARVTADASEAWDGWMRLAEALEPIAGARCPAPLPGATGHETEAMARLSAAVEAGHRKVAGALDAASLQYGIGRRSWFAAVAVFHWNRLALTPDEMLAVVADALSRFDPP